MNADLAIAIVVWGIGLSALFGVWQRRWPVWLRLVIAVGVGIVLLTGYVFLNAGAGPTTLGPENAPWYGRSPYREALFFGLMLLGMAARYFTKAIETRRAKIEELRKTTPEAPKPALEFDVWEFAYPFFASVVTFGALLSQIKEPGVSVASVTLSFQTGFFWQTILAAKEKGS